MIDVVEADTTVGAFRCYSHLRVPTSKRSGGDSKSLGSLVGRKGRTRLVEKRDGSRVSSFKKRNNARFHLQSVDN